MVDALHASQVRDSLADVPARPGKERGHTIPRVAWWCEAATAAVEASGLSHGQVAAEVVRRYGYTVDSSRISKCLSGKVLTLELARHLSDMLALPPPIIEPRNEDEALRLLGKLERERIRAQVGVLAAGVRETSEQGQPVALQRQHGPRPKRGRLD